jgi:hypothetical protein
VHFISYLSNQYPMKIAILTLALTCLGKSYKKVSVLGNNYAVYTPPKAGDPPLFSRTSSADSCGFLGTMTSYPKPGALGVLIGTKKCFDYCYANSYQAAHCAANEAQGFYCKCLSYVPTEEEP